MGRKLDIEPLSDAAWAHIEASVFERPRARSAAAMRPASTRKLALALAFAIGATCALAGGLLWRASVSHPGITPSRIETRDASAHVDFEGASLDVAPASAVRWSGDDRTGHTVVLEHGSVDCEVVPRASRPPFIVRSGDVKVTVVGTHFRVTHEQASTRVAVDRGTVDIDDGERHVLVHAGESWPAPTAIVPSNSTLAPLPLLPRPSSNTIVPHVASPSARPSPVSPLSTAAPADRFRDAQRLEASKPEDALAIYRALAEGSGPWAMNALFAEARLEAELGHRDRARPLLQSYIARFPTGPNVDDAQRLLAEMR